MLLINDRYKISLQIFLLLATLCGNAEGALTGHPAQFNNSGNPMQEHELRKQVDVLREHKRDVVPNNVWAEFKDAHQNDPIKGYIDRHDCLFSQHTSHLIFFKGDIDPTTVPLTIAEIKILYNAYDAWAIKDGRNYPQLKIEDGGDASPLNKAKANLTKFRDKFEAEGDKLRAADIELYKLQSSAKVAVPVGLALIAGFFICKEGFSYWKETAMNPPFVDDTNDVNALNEFYDWFTGKSKKGFKPTDKDLEFNDDKKEEMQLLKKAYKKDIQNNTPTDHYLFFGPHGTGKTHFARKLATEISSTYYIISASAFTEQKGSENFRQLMNYIRSSNSRPVIVIDEADNLLRHSTEQSSLELTVFNQILDATGETDNHVATFIFCTNLPDSIDERMKSRLTMVEFTNPDHKTREKIINNNLEYYFEKAVGGHATIDYKRITPEAIAEVAKITEGWSGRALDKGFEKLRRYMWAKKNFDCTSELFINFFKEIMLKEKVLRDSATKLQNFYKEKARASHRLAAAAA